MTGPLGSKSLDSRTHSVMISISVLKNSNREYTDFSTVQGFHAGQSRRRCRKRRPGGIYKRALSKRVSKSATGYPQLMHSQAGATENFDRTESRHNASVRDRRPCTKRLRASVISWSRRCSATLARPVPHWLRVARSQVSIYHCSLEGKLSSIYNT